MNLVGMPYFWNSRANPRGGTDADDPAEEAAAGGDRRLITEYPSIGSQAELVDRLREIGIAATQSERRPEGGGRDGERKLAEASGTLAGSDTLFVATATREAQSLLLGRFRAYLKRSGPPGVDHADRPPEPEEEAPEEEAEASPSDAPRLTTALSCRYHLSVGKKALRSSGTLLLTLSTTLWSASAQAPKTASSTSAAKPSPQALYIVSDTVLGEAPPPVMPGSPELPWRRWSCTARRLATSRARGASSRRFRRSPPWSCGGSSPCAGVCSTAQGRRSPRGRC
jgi:hypothetical protein